MAEFKIREEADKTPDVMGEVYEFVKISLDEFVAFVDGLEGPVSREIGPVCLFLEHTRPDRHWYVTHKRIYHSSNLTNLHPLCFSETQKWVAKVEQAVEEFPRPVLTQAEVREIVRVATGK